MQNVFVEVQLSDGRKMSVEELIRDYERLLQMLPSEKAVTQNVARSRAELKVEEWFLINREVIAESQELIHLKCYLAGNKGQKLWERFVKSNRIANMDPERYTRFIETYVLNLFDYTWGSSTEQELREIGENAVYGEICEMCDEVICDLELQMRICNGEPIYDLINKKDIISNSRVIKCRNGDTGLVGGGYIGAQPAAISRNSFDPNRKHANATPYVFRRVPSNN